MNLVDFKGFLRTQVQMESIWDMSLPIIQALQTIAWLEWPMRVITWLGSEAFFLLFFSFIYWCISPPLGIRLVLILLVSTSLNTALKLALAQPRPYWYSAQITAHTLESSFGLPSGHAQNSLVVWAKLAQHWGPAHDESGDRPWICGVAVLIIGGISLSRIYLGVHFPTDVLVGWGVGGVVLLAFNRVERSVAQWICELSRGQKLMLALGASLILLLPGIVAWQLRQPWQMPSEWMQTLAVVELNGLPQPMSPNTAISVAGTGLGLILGRLSWQPPQWFNPKASLRKRAMQYLVGIAGAIALWAGLGAVFPDDASLLAYGLLYLRYSLLGYWIAAAGPWLFHRLAA